MVYTGLLIKSCLLPLLVSQRVAAVPVAPARLGAREAAGATNGIYKPIEFDNRDGTPVSEVERLAVRQQDSPGIDAADSTVGYGHAYKLATRQTADRWNLMGYDSANGYHPHKVFVRQSDSASSLEQAQQAQADTAAQSAAQNQVDSSADRTDRQSEPIRLARRQSENGQGGSGGGSLGYGDPDLSGDGQSGNDVGGSGGGSQDYLRLARRQGTIGQKRPVCERQSSPTIPEGESLPTVPEGETLNRRTDTIAHKPPPYTTQPPTKRQTGRPGIATPVPDFPEKRQDGSGEMYQGTDDFEPEVDPAQPPPVKRQDTKASKPNNCSSKRQDTKASKPNHCSRKRSDPDNKGSGYNPLAGQSVPVKDSPSAMKKREDCDPKNPSCNPDYGLNPYHSVSDPAKRQETPEPIGVGVPVIADPSSPSYREKRQYDTPTPEPIGVGMPVTADTSVPSYSEKRQTGATIPKQVINHPPTTYQPGSGQQLDRRLNDPDKYLVLDDKTNEPERRQNLDPTTETHIGTPEGNNGASNQPNKNVPVTGQASGSYSSNKKRQDMDPTSSPDGDSGGNMAGPDPESEQNGSPGGYMKRQTGATIPKQVINHPPTTYQPERR